jgi:tRNA pseudouridine55 synthase
MSPEPFTDGGLVIDKPSGPTSHDIVALARRALHERRIGHTGTLDPLATGVLVLLVGRATRLSQFLVSDEKEYIADVRLGVSTPTYDAASLPELRAARSEEREASGEERRASGEERGATGESIEEALRTFRGTFLQTPPPFSAKKVGGIAAYERARKQEAVDLQPVEVSVRELELVRPSLLDPRPSSLLRLRIVCSAGFYVRSLAHELGQALGCGAHLEALRRTRAGRFGLDRAVPVELLATNPNGARDAMIPMHDLLGHLAALIVSDEGARRVAHGNSLTPNHIVSATGSATGSGPVGLFDASGTLLAVAERRSDASLHPLTVLM